MSDLCAVPWCANPTNRGCYGVCEPHRREELALSHLEEEAACIQTDADIGRQVDAEVRQVLSWLRRYDDGVGTPYGRRALSNACLELAATAEGQRNRTLNAMAYSLGRLVGGGEIDADQVESCLLEVALAIGLSERYAVDTIGRAVRAGMVNPRIILDRHG